MQRMTKEAERLKSDLKHTMSKPVLSGPLGGSLFSRRLLTSTQAWTSTSTSVVTRR